MIKELKDYYTPFLLMLDLATSVLAFTAASGCMTLLFPGTFSGWGGQVALFKLSSEHIVIQYVPLALLFGSSPVLRFLLDRRNTACHSLSFSGQCRYAVYAVMGPASVGVAALAKTVTLGPAAGFTAVFISFLAVLHLLTRLLACRYFLSGNPKKNMVKRLLVVGTNARAFDFANYIDHHPECGMLLVGFASHTSVEVSRPFGNHRVLCTVDNFSEVLKPRMVDCVVVAPAPELAPYIDQLFSRCHIEGTDFAFLSGRNHNGRASVLVERVGEDRLVVLKSVVQHPLKLALKRMFDFFLTLVLIFVLLPLWLLIPLLIKRDSKGPVFFRQERIGKNGRRFKMFKFRSMVVGAEKYQAQLQHLNEMDGPAFKIKDDPRQTRFGRILRRTSLDELPQLFNVLKGDISLVGPRPPIYQEVMAYRPWERKRLAVIPGITCLWQISGRNNLKFDEWMKLDLMYIDNWSFAQDIKILFKTIPAVISKEGAR